MDDLLIRPCPACAAAYGEHTLVSLAECVESILGDDEEPDRDPWLFLLGPRVETVAVRDGLL